MIKNILKIFKKSFLVFFIIFVIALHFSSKILAQNYEITNFDAHINLNQDFSLTIKETIDTNFLVPKHGIYRVIPYIYTHNGKSLGNDDY